MGDLELEDRNLAHPKESHGRIVSAMVAGVLHRPQQAATPTLTLGAVQALGSHSAYIQRGADFLAKKLEFRSSSCLAACSLGLSFLTYSMRSCP